MVSNFLRFSFLNMHFILLVMYIFWRFHFLANSWLRIFRFLVGALLYQLYIVLEISFFSGFLILRVLFFSVHSILFVLYILRFLRYCFERILDFEDLYLHCASYSNCYVYIFFWGFIFLVDSWLWRFNVLLCILFLLLCKYSYWF